MVMQMSQLLAEELARISSTNFHDITMLLDTRYTTADRVIIKAKLSFEGVAKVPFLTIVLGLRSSIMDSFDKFSECVSRRYVPCDIPGLIPAIATTIKYQNKGLVGFAIGVGDLTHLILTFEGKDGKKGRFHSLAVVVEEFMRECSEWTSVLLRILSNDPVMSLWKLTNDELRELLLGESGFVTMPWFTHSLSCVDRGRILDRVLDASKAFLTSVLSQKQLEEPIVRGLIDWLEDLSPLPEIASYSHKVGEMS
jgi:hypothetical protein